MFSHVHQSHIGTDLSLPPLWSSFSELFEELSSGLYVVFSQFSAAQSLSHIRLFATPWTAARQASPSITNSQSLLKLTAYHSY